MFLEILQDIIHPVYGHSCLMDSISRMCSINNDWSVWDYLQYYIWFLAVTNIIVLVVIMLRNKSSKNISILEWYMSIWMSILFLIFSAILLFLFTWSSNIEVFIFFLLSILISVFFFRRYKKWLKWNSSNIDAIHTFLLAVFASIIMILWWETWVPSFLIFISIGIAFVSFLWAMKLKCISPLQAFLDLGMAILVFYSIYYTGFSDNISLTQWVIIYRYGMILLGFSFLFSALLIFIRLGHLSFQKKN